jgi:hypothetical protein
VRRGLQALSSLYVERRARLGAGPVFDGAGKRAAFALFYGPLHFLVVGAVVEGLGAPTPRRILELGCGTGAAGAAWALAGSEPGGVDGVDLHPWAVGEARWSLRQLGLAGSVRRGDLGRVRLPSRGGGVLLAWTVNELDGPARAALLPRLLGAAAAGAAVLVVEPIARGVAPWWPDWAEAFRAAGGRADEWRLRPRLPPILARLDRAAGLDHRVAKARSLWLPGR